jgi:hypothetical protein
VRPIPGGCGPHAHDSMATAGADRQPVPGWPPGARTACPADLVGAPLSLRASDLYECHGLSSYGIAEIVGISRQRVTRALHRRECCCVAVASRSGRRAAGRRSCADGGQATDARVVRDAGRWSWFGIPAVRCHTWDNGRWGSPCKLRSTR